MKRTYPKTALLTRLGEDPEVQVILSLKNVRQILDGHQDTVQLFCDRINELYKVATAIDDKALATTQQAGEPKV